jgi:hypothetical protein
MMQIEPGDLFVITKGFQLGGSSFIYASGFGDDIPDSKPQYDRSYESIVFKAVEVCGPVIAAEVVAGKTFRGQRMYHLNLNDVTEVWPVTPEFLSALLQDPACRPAG